ncbi:MAG: DUF2330 domain-containing protein [Flavobacteriales bacterium]
MILFLREITRWFRSDGRHFQLVSQLLFLTYGIFVLGWNADGSNYLAAFVGAVGTQLLFIRQEQAPMHSLKSALVTTLGLCLLLKANSPVLFFLAGALAIGQKFAFRHNGKHLWNPAAFGIVMAILLSGEAWVSPGQWGSAAVLVMVIGTAGLAVLSRVGRLETGLAFILTLAAAEYIRTVVYLGWGHDFYLHKLSSGAIWLFSFFMITDPMTIPSHRIARIVWASGVALCAFYLSNFHFIPAAPIWVLVAATPLSPFIDRLFRAESFSWIQRRVVSIPSAHRLSSRIKPAILLLLLSLYTLPSHAFCGFYVAKADATLFNNKSEVILVRDGLRTVITMSNDFKGDVRDFAMVVPVPVVLKEKDIRVVNRRVFDALDAYSAPRLAEYYDPEPCQRFDAVMSFSETSRKRSIAIEAQEMPESDDVRGVTIEARYEIGEYDILILSATESTGLRDWLIENGYRIPAAADEVLDPYIRSNTKFFVVKVNLDRLRASGFDYLSPIQIAFEHEKLMLPIRLGMANSTGYQDMIVYAFTRTGRVECTNYRTVRMPTARNIPVFIKEEFGPFYKNTFDHTWKNEGRNVVMLEYAWNVSPQQSGMKCDPCVGPPPIYQDFADAGVWWSSDQNAPGNVFFTRMHVRYSRDLFPADLQFQVTPNAENYQARYILNNPAQGPFDCEEARHYLEQLNDRRRLELEEYYALTGMRHPREHAYMSEYGRYLKKTPEPGQQGRHNVPSSSPAGDPSDREKSDTLKGDGLKPYEWENDDRGSTPASIPADDPSSTPGAGPWSTSIVFVAASVLILWLSRRRQSASAA